MKRLSNISIYIAIFLILLRGVAFAASGTIYPSADVSTNNWTSGTCTTNLYSCISEGTTAPNDADYIQTTNGVTNGDFVFSNTQTPSDLGHVSDITITVRAVATGGRTSSLDVFYSTDGTDPSITIGTQQALSLTITDYTFIATGLNLTKAQIDNLQIKLRGNAASGGGGGQTAVRVTAVQTDLTYSTFNPSSTSYKLLNYGFGAGGIATSSSTNYMFQGILGEVETASLSSASYLALPGLTYTLEPKTPLGPTLTNPGNYYNKLHIVIDDGGNPTDATFAIQISSDPSFNSGVYYVQTDGTLSSTPAFQSYTLWGSTIGVNIIGLNGNTTYYARVAARTGAYQQGLWSASGNATTSSPTLSFSVQTTSQPTPPFSINLGNLTAGSITTSSDQVTANISTNANSGGLIYIYGANNGLKSTTASNYTINSTTNDLTSAAEGYGIRGTSVTQTSGGPMQFDSPYTGAGNNVGIIDTNKRTLSDSSNAPVTNGQASFELKAKVSNTTPSANDYADIITLIATGSF